MGRGGHRPRRRDVGGGAGRGVPADHRDQRHDQRVHRRAGRAGAGGCPGRRPTAGRGPAPARRARLGEGPHLAGRRAGHQRVRRPRRLRPRPRRRPGGPPEGRRGRGGGQDEQPGVLLPRLHRQRPARADQQPVGHGPDPGWLLGRRRCIRGVRRHTDRPRHRRRRLHPHPRGVLRRRRAQADGRCRPQPTRFPRLADALRRRSPHPDRPGRRPRPGGDGRALAARRALMGARRRRPARRGLRAARLVHAARGGVRGPRLGAGRPVGARRVPASRRHAGVATAPGSSRRPPTRRTRRSCGTTSRSPRGSRPRGRCWRGGATG